MKRWVVWRYVQKYDRKGNLRDPNKKSSWDKPPLTADGRAAHTDDDNDLCDYATAAAALFASAQTQNPLRGAGFAPRPDDGFLFLDLDDCRDKDTGAIAPWAQEVIADCNSYTEISPSLTGIRIIGLADGWAGKSTKTPYSFTANGAPAKGEIYLGSNYVTITFDRLSGTPDQLSPIGEAANRLAARASASLKPAAPLNPDTPPVQAPVDVIREALSLIPNPDSNWTYWKETIGMAIFAATDGSDEGFAAWDEWSRRSPAYGESVTCEEEWDRMRVSPPTRNSGYASLHREAQRHEAAAGRTWKGGTAWQQWKIRESGFTPIVIPDRTNPAQQIVQAVQRPTIQVHPGNLSGAADEAEQALLATQQAIYVRGGQLVTPVSRTVRSQGLTTTTVGLHTFTLAGLRDVLSKVATWVRYDGRAQKLVTIDPPNDVVMVLLERATARPFPEIAGVVAVPGLLPDGRLSTGVGYDPDLRVHRVIDPYLRMPENWGTRHAVMSDAATGLGHVNALLEGFPFVDEVDRSVALALIFTAVCRSAVSLAPMFSVSATDAGTGKSHLIDLASLIATGQRCPVASASDNPQELDKRLHGLIAAGYPMISLDNVNGVLRSDVLNQAVERERIRIRLLGASSIIEVESCATFTANGNGLQVSGDMVRRNLPIRLDAGVEQPETRTFRFDPLKMVENDRGSYVAAVLDILRAHAAAGFPGSKNLRPLGSYEAWSRHVRGALIWLGWPDPVLAMDRARADDPDLKNLRDMLVAWNSRLGSDKAYTAKEAADTAMQAGFGVPAHSLQVVGGPAESVVERGELLDIMLRAAGYRGIVDPQRLSNWLGRHSGRITGGLRFVKDGGTKSGGGDTHVTKWRIERVRPDLRIVN
jgi:hypothetical protein